MVDSGDGSSKPRRVLVVDDWFDSAEMLATFLLARGHETYVALDGRSAIAEATRLAPDIVILDIGLPDLDGCAVARLLRKELPDLVLVALTGYDEEEDRRDFAEAGFDVHLSKPVELRALAALVASVSRVR